MDHLLNSRVQVERLKMRTVNGRSVNEWRVEPDLDYVPCRLDLQFVRPGKDQPMAVQVGVAPDRTGLMFYSTDWPLKAGDRVRSVVNDAGEIPVPGVFEIRVIPDIVQGYSSGHHVEVQIFEVAQQIAPADFPGGVDNADPV